RTRTASRRSPHARRRARAGAGRTRHPRRSSGSRRRARRSARRPRDARAAPRTRRRAPRPACRVRTRRPRPPPPPPRPSPPPHRHAPPPPPQAIGLFALAVQRVGEIAEGIDEDEGLLGRNRAQAPPAARRRDRAEQSLPGALDAVELPGRQGALRLSARALDV